MVQVIGGWVHQGERYGTHTGLSVGAGGMGMMLICIKSSSSESMLGGSGSSWKEGCSFVCISFPWNWTCLSSQALLQAHSLSLLFSIQVMFWTHSIRYARCVYFQLFVLSTQYPQPSPSLTNMGTLEECTWSLLIWQAHPCVPMSLSLSHSLTPFLLTLKSTWSDVTVQLSWSS